jgi:hypothetical protein
VNDDPRRFTAAQAQAGIVDADFERVAQRREAEHFDLVPFQQAELQQALHDRVVAADRLHAGALTDSELVQGKHGGHIRRRAVGVLPGRDRGDKDLRRPLAAQAEAGAADLEQARAAGAQHLKPAADPDAEFRQPADPTRLAVDLSDLGPFARIDILKG